MGETHEWEMTDEELDEMVAEEWATIFGYTLDECLRELAEADEPVVLDMTVEVLA